MKVEYFLEQLNTPNIGSFFKDVILSASKDSSQTACEEILLNNVRRGSYVVSRKTFKENSNILCELLHVANGNEFVALHTMYDCSAWQVFVGYVSKGCVSKDLIYLYNPNLNEVNSYIAEELASMWVECEYLITERI